jgi:hypothetical protein
MTLFTDADDGIVAAAYGVLTGERREGTEDIRRVEREEGSAFVYRLDPDADPETVAPDTVTENGEIPDADAVLWRADRDLVEREVERRDLNVERDART